MIKRQQDLIMKKIDKSFLEKALALINTVLFSMDHPKSPESMNFFQADTYRFYFLMSFMKEYFDGNEWIDDIEKLKSICKIDPK